MNRLLLASLLGLFACATEEVDTSQTEADVRHVCATFVLCAQGTTWNEATCKCKPSSPGGEVCGPSVCHSGDHCCPGRDDPFCVEAVDPCPY